MPDKHPDTDRWGGPGASHENRKKPRPDPTVKDADQPDRINQHSRVSGGGGEGDVHHGHSKKAKRDFEAPRGEKAADRPH